MVRSGPHDHHRVIRPHPAGRDERRAMTPPDLSWPLAAIAASSSLRRGVSPWWQPALVALRPQVWPKLVAALMLLGLLLAFEQVVSQAVAQGDLRRTATAAHVDSVWRCKLLSGRADRNSCLAQAMTEQDPMSLHGREAHVLQPMEK